MRTSLIYILIFFSSLATAQVDTFSLDDIPTKKCTTNRFPVKWEAIDFTAPQQKVKTTLTDVGPEAFSGLKTTYLGKPIFEEIIPESIDKKTISRSHVKDIAKLDIQYLDRKHGLPGSSIYAMERDVDGNILFSTDHGTLNSYDGTELTSYFFNDTIGDIRHISARTQSKKWISTTAGVYYQEDESFYVLKNNWGIHFWRATMDQEGVLWMTSYGDGIYYIKNDSLFHLINDEIKIDSKEIIRDQKGQIWIACMPGIIRMTERDTVIFRLKRKDRQASSIIEFDNKIYFGRFRKGMQVIEGDKVFDLALGIDEYSPFDFEVTKNGLWFSVYGQGLQFLKRDGTFHKFDEKDGLAQRSAHTLVSDDFGNIWVGDLFDGISIFSEANYIPNYNLPRLHDITDIEVVGDTTWFFYAWGAPIRKIGNTFYQLSIPSYFADKIYMQDGHICQNDKAWVQCYDYGYIKYENDTFVTYEYSKDPQETLNHQLSLDRFGRIWAINLKNELRYLEGDSIHLCHKKGGSTENIFHKVKQLIIDEDQELYYNNPNEVFWAQQEAIYRHSFPREIIKYIFKHPQTGVWVLTDKQLHHLVKDEITKSYKLELPKQFMIRSAIDVGGNIHLTTSDNLWILKLNKDKFEIQQAFGNNDFSRSKLFHYQNGVMISGTGINHSYQPWWNLNKEYQPKLSIKNITVAGEEINNSSELVLKPNENMLVDLNYQDWGKNRQLEYQLLKDKKPSNWSVLNGRKISFDNLSSGEYKLKIRASNQSNKWVKTAMEFKVTPFWYESLWFFLLLISALLIAFYFIYRYRSQRAKTMELKLNKAVNLKTKELAEEKKQVEKQLQQKELLLKEVNHRVMNNMQMVSSILELQNSKVIDQASKENLIKARDRIKALALAHQHLYKYEEYETIMVKEYLSVIEKSLKLDKNIHINLNINPNLKLPIERAQSLGLVLNELISNSIKHAWPKNISSKKIDVALTEKMNEYYWEYADNGIGMQTAVNDNDGLGTTLIKAIADRQLSGELEYVSHDGFKIIIKFPKS